MRLNLSVGFGVPGLAGWIHVCPGGLEVLKILAFSVAIPAKAGTPNLRKLTDSLDCTLMCKRASGHFGNQKIEESFASWGVFSWIVLNSPLGSVSNHLQL